MKETAILTEKEAVELFIYFLATARVQIDDPDHYGPIRLLAAAENLRDLIENRVSSPVKKLFKDTEPIINQAQIVMNDEDKITAELDRVSEIVAQYLVESNKLKEKVS